MEEDNEQTGQGGMMDDLMNRGRDAAGQSMNDPDMRDRVAGQAEERFGNVPGMSQAADAFRGSGGSTTGQDTGNEPTGDYGSGEAQSTDYGNSGERSSGYDSGSDTSYTGDADTSSSDSSQY